MQWTDFLKGVVKGRDYPDDPELRAAAPQLVTHCGAPCFGYSVVNSTTVNEVMKDGLPGLAVDLARRARDVAGPSACSSE